MRHIGISTRLLLAQAHNMWTLRLTTFGALTATEPLESKNWRDVQAPTKSGHLSDPAFESTNTLPPFFGSSGTEVTCRLS